MMRKFALSTAIALLALNAVLLVAQPGLALPRGLAAYFFGPDMVRAEIVMQTATGVELYRVDRGRIRAVGADFVVLRERDGVIATVQIAPDAEVIGAPARPRGRRAPFLGLRRGMYVETVRLGDAPAERVRILQR
jgi:hypothetical protein